MIVGVAQTSRNQGLHQLGEVAERLNTAVFKCLPLALTSPRKSHLRVVSGATVTHLKSTHLACLDCGATRSTGIL